MFARFTCKMQAHYNTRFALTGSNYMSLTWGYGFCRADIPIRRVFGLTIPPLAGMDTCPTEALGKQFITLKCFGFSANSILHFGISSYP